MKRIFIVLVALMILLTSVSFAEDLSALSDEELFTLCRDVLDEIERRHSAPAGSEAQEDLPAFATLNEALAAAEDGFASWGQADYIIAAMKHDGKYYRLITMLDDHAKELYRAWETDDYSGYEAYREYAFTLPVSRIEELMEMPLEQAELDALVGKTLPELLTEGFEPYCVYIEGPGRDNHTIGLSFGLYSYDFEFDMTDDEYAKYCDDDVTGDWPAKCIYYNGFANRVFSLDYNADGSLRTGTAPIREKTAEPADTDAMLDLKVKNGEFTGFSYRALWPDNVSFTSPEPAEEPAAKTPEISDSTVLYYLPRSLKNEYHLDPNCSLYNPDCLPLPCSFTYAELSDDMYRDLEPCPNCGAPERPLRFATLRDAMNTQAEQQSVSERSDRIVLLMEKDGEYLRVITMLDARAKALYAVMQEDEPSHQAFTSYAWGLPVTSVEKFTSKPLDQWELGSMSGKTIRELIGSRTDCFTPYQDVSDPPVVELSFGLFSYNFEVDTTREEYLKLQDTDAFWDLKVKNGTFSGFSYHALDMDSIEEP